jgi:hypothetical protein
MKKLLLLTVLCCGMLLASTQTLRAPEPTFAIMAITAKAPYPATEPLGDAIITINNIVFDNPATFTGVEGVYYSIEITCIGYETKTFNQLMEAGITFVTAIMQPLPNPGNL